MENTKEYRNIVAEKSHDAYRHLKRHRTVLPARARLSCIIQMRNTELQCKTAYRSSSKELTVRSLIYQVLCHLYFRNGVLSNRPI